MDDLYYTDEENNLECIDIEKYIKNRYKDSDGDIKLLLNGYISDYLKDLSTKMSLFRSHIEIYNDKVDELKNNSKYISREEVIEYRYELETLYKDLLYEYNRFINGESILNYIDKDFESIFYNEFTDYMSISDVFEDKDFMKKLYNINQ